MSKKVLKNLGDLGGILPTSMHSGCYREQRKSVDYYTDKYNVETEIEQRAMDEVSNGAFSKRSLPQEASFHVPVDNTELPEMENVFLETMNSVQTQIASVTSEQIPDVQLICELDTIDPDVLEYDVQTINSNGMNNTLSTPMTDGAIESLKGLEGMIKDLTVRANKTDDSLNSVLGEMVTVRISVKKVEQSFDALETSLKTVDTKAKQMDTRLIGVVENLNKVLQDYEDQFEVHDNRLLEIKDDAGKALAETNTNSIMIKEVCKIVSTQKEVLRKLTAPNGPNLNTISLDRPSALRVSTIERNSVHARTSVTPSPMEDSIVSASDSRNDHSSMFQDLGSLSSIVRQAHSQIVVMDDLDVNCDNDVGLRQPDNNPGFQPVQVGREDRVQRRDLQHHQDKNSDNGVRTSIRSSRERGSLSSSPPRSRKRDNSMKREVAENKLRRKIAELKKIIANNLLNTKTSEAEIKDAVVRQVPVLNELIESCDNAMDKYSEFSLIDEELMELLSVTIDEAGTWKDQAESLYKSAEIFDSNSGSRLDIVVKPFSGSGGQTVYAFLRDFENSFRGQGNDAKKVSKLYNHYLSNKVKFQASKMSKNYSDLKEWLVDRYGNPVTVVDMLLSKIDSNPRAASFNIAKKAEHFMMLDFVLSEIDETSNEAAIDKSDYQQHLYSQPIMKRIIDLIPYEDKLIFFKLLRKQGLDSKLVRGERAFFTLRQFVDNEAEAHSSNTPDIVQEETSKVEQSAAAVACPLLDDEEPDPEEHRQDERPTVLVAQMGQPQPARSTTTKPAGWYSSMLTFPCPIDNHNHELATCTEFFSSTPKQRRDIGRKKICFVCMGPMDKCVKKKNGNKLARMCVNVKKAGPLSCRACADYCRACGISSPPFCVIMCQDPSHPKPTIEEVGRVLNDYWPSFNPDTVTPSMVLSGGSLHNTVSMIPPCVKSSARLHVDPFEVIFDTQTGNSIRVGMNEGQKSNFPTPSEAQANPSIFVMQWLRIGSTDCLCFFDSGANIHMISGDLAEKEGVKMLSQDSTVLKILGKGEVATDYGTYRLNMSTTDQTGYQSFICHGLSEIAGPFDKHSLDKVNSELRATMEYSTFDAATLPDYVGGSKVHLLLGIHDQVLPVHLFTLPSGISVYRSPFTDIFGSNICYGGTHESFKKSATPLGACHAVHFISAELRDPAPPDDGDVLIVEYHAKDPCPPCSPPLSRVDGQCFQIGAPPKGQNFFVDMATLLLSTVIWMCRIWKHELLATFEIFFSYLMCLYMVNLSKLFFSTHSGNIATTVLGATGCPKVMVSTLLMDFGYQLCFDNMFFYPVFFCGKNNFFTQSKLMSIIVAGIMCCHIVMIWIYLCVVKALQHHFIRIVFKFFERNGSGLKVICEHFQCVLIPAHMSRMLYGVCNVDTVVYFYLTSYWLPKELTEKTRQQTLSKRQLLVTLEFVILVLTRKHTDMLIAGLMDPLKYMYQVSAAIDNDHVKVWLHDAGPPSMVIFQEWRSECFIKYPVKPTLTAPPSWSSVVRGWRDVAILFSEDDIYLNSKQYFQALKTSDIDTCE